MSHHRKLCLLCVRGVSTFDPDAQGIDEHVDWFLHSEDCRSLDADDRTFISEVMAGCIRFDKLVKIIVDCFYAKDGRTCLKADYNIFKVIGYLVMFRMEELGMSHFRRFVMSQDTLKMYKFLSFVFDEVNLKTWIPNEFCKVYDHSFVQTNVLSPMLRYHPEVLDLIQQLKDRVENNRKAKKDSPKVSGTETKPFNLTQPRPRAVPTPEKIPLLKVHRPVPRSTYSTPSEQEAMERLRETARQRAEDRAYQAEKMKFSCANTEKSIKTKTVIKQILQEREEKEHFEPVKPSAMPSNVHDSVSVKMNMAAVLREGARVQKEEDLLLKKMADLAAGERDGTEFLKWQEDMRQKELAETLTEITQKHLAGQLSYEEAIIARQSYQAENREKVMVLKEEYQHLMKSFFKEREAKQKEMKRLVEIIADGRENTKEAREKLHRMKQSMVQEVAKESRALMQQALEEAEQEMRKKIELIKQIRAIESIPVIRHNFVDPTESSGHGLLSEMSIAELHERLALVRLACLEEEEARRKEIATNKETKERLIKDTRAAIDRHRNEKIWSSEESKVQKKESFARLLKDTRDDNLVGLQEQLEAKKKARLKMQQSAGLSRPKNKNKSSQDSTSKRRDKRASKSATSLRMSPDRGAHSSAMATLLRSSAHS